MAVHRDETESKPYEGRAFYTGSPRVTHSRQLLEVAQRFIDQGDYGIAIIVSHMACEIAVERVLSQAVQAGDIPDKLVRKFKPGYGVSLNRDPDYDLYVALTKDKIRENPTIWAPYKESIERRNVVVHRAKTMEKKEAEESLQAATQFVAHLKQS